MKPNSASCLILAVALASMSLILAGCAHTMSAHTISIKAVDSATSQPLAGVSTWWRQDYKDLLLGSSHYGPTNLPPSQENGVINIRGLHPTWSSRFIFSCCGYSNVYAICSGDTLTLADQITSLPGDQFILEGPLTSITPSNGCFIIPMPR